MPIGRLNRVFGVTISDGSGAWRWVCFLEFFLISLTFSSPRGVTTEWYQIFETNYSIIDFRGLVPSIFDPSKVLCSKMKNNFLNNTRL
jgi:hypothetical protein